MAKPPVLRTKSVTTKVTEAEYERLESLAEASGVNMSEWMRGRLLGRDGADRDEDTATVLGEVLALRTILINLLFSVSNGNAPAETTAAWAVAKFEHDSSRPVEGYAAPQLHTHAVVFNVTETADGNTRALQPQELYKTQQYATAVYRSELAERLQGMGYEIERGEHGQPEIKGYSREYLEASSPRRQQIEAHMAAEGRTGAGAAQVAAHQTRDQKQPLSHEEVRERHQAMARVHGDQPQRVLEEAAERPGVELRPEQSEIAARGAVTYARERGMEREAVTDERSLMRDALKHTMGEARLPEIRAEFEKRVQSSELIEVPRREGLAGRAFTTGEMQGYERELINRMKSSQGNRDVLAEGSIRQQTMEQHSQPPPLQVLPSYEKNVFFSCVQKHMKEPTTPRRM